MSAELLRMAEDALRTILEHCELADDNGYSTLGTSFVSDVCRPVYVALKDSTPPAQPSVSEGSVPEMAVSMCSSSQYAKGWNDCRAAMIAAAPQPTTKKGQP